MSLYIVVNQEENRNPTEISENHFGANLVTIYDEEFGHTGSQLPDLTAEMGITNFRFPGGSATEHFFDMSQPNAPVSSYDHTQELLPMSKMFEQAGILGARASIVLPTKRAFTQSAPDAMLSGRYGSRDEFSKKYMSDLQGFLEYIITESRVKNVKISALELGNEFWGSGEMTASEYGTLVARLLPFVQGVFENMDVECPPMIVQSTTAASEIYSPLEDTVVYVSNAMGGSTVATERYVEEQYSGNVPEGWEKVVVSGQGRAYHQVADIAEQINATPGSAELVSGIVGHYYTREGLDTVDTAKEFLFSQFSRLDSLLERASSSPEVSYHITEWNANSVDAAHNRGLQHSAMMVEMFYEQVTHGVDASQIWPLTFDHSQGITLTNLAQDRLSLAGKTFELMREHLVGLTPIVDWSLDDVIDVHGFDGADSVVFIISERSGHIQTDLSIDFWSVLKEGDYVVEATFLSDGASGGADHLAPPEVHTEHFIVNYEGMVEASLDPWSLAFFEFIKPEHGDTVLEGSDDKDILEGGRGNDYINGASSADELFGHSGDDTIYGGAGFDTITGGWGSDSILGDHGKDRVFGGGGKDSIFGGAWHDTVHGGAGDDQVFGEAGCDYLVGGKGNDTISGGDWNDTLYGGLGDDELLGGRGSDRLFSGIGNDALFGGEGRDKLFGGNGNDYLIGGRHRDKIFGGKGRDKLFAGEGNDALYGGWGRDKIFGGEGRDKLFGGIGNDELYGGIGSDLLSDGQGRDTLNGGGGADRFVFVSDGLPDVISDFEFGQDILDLTGWGQFEARSLTFREETGQALGSGGTWLVHNDEAVGFEGAVLNQVKSLVESDFFVF